MEAWVNEKLKELTLEEKAFLLSGTDVWRTYGVPRLGIPQLNTTDGPAGVRGGTMVDGTTAAMGPSAVSLAATFDVDLLFQFGELLATEVKDKQAEILLAPTVCLHRSPLGGRNFESLSGEEPFLGGKLAASYIRGVQKHGIGACIKHYAANDQETKRFVVNQIMTDRCLREIHLVPFQIAIRESNPWCVIASYSKINGIYASNNKELLTDILRGEWGYDGLVMSDWFGVNSIVPSCTAGMDLEMPGPPRKRGKHLVDAVEKGFATEKELEVNVRRVLELVYKTEKWKTPNKKEGKEIAVDRPEHRSFLRKAAADGIVLLKNEKKLLPLDIPKLKKVAFIGPNADKSIATGGGSANLNAHYRQTPYQSFVKNAPSSLTVTHNPGCLAHKWIPLFPSHCVSPDNGEPTMYMEYFANTDFSGPVVHSAHRASTILACYDNLPASIFKPGLRYSYRATGLLTPKTSGSHTFSMGTCGPGRLLVDGEKLIDIWDRTKDSERSEMFMAYASPEQRVTMKMEAGKTYKVAVEAVSRELDPIPVDYMKELYRDEVMDGARVGFMEEVDEERMMREAVDAAEEADVVVAVVGRNMEWESEAYDMKSMDLPGRQNELIEKVLKVNRNVVVVNQSGTPIHMPWVDEVDTVVQAWYQGQELGNALYDVLTGAVNPSGKLPVTFPRRIQDTPTFHNFPGESDTVVYGEGIWLGYRHYERADIAPIFPFGFGLSYTSFSYSNLQLSSIVFREGQALSVHVDVENTGEREGKETVQFYIGQTSRTGLPRPEKELKAFAKVALEPKQSKTLGVEIDKYCLGYYDEKKGRWVVDKDAEFEVAVAKNSVDVVGRAKFRIDGAMDWIN